MNQHQTMTRLNQALMTLDDAYSRLAKKHGLNYNALMLVSLVTAEEKLTQKQIGELLYLPKSTVHSILKEFLDQQLLQLTAGHNKKEKWVVLTPQGKEYFAAVLTEMENFEERLLTALGAETCAFLVTTAERLEQIVEEQAINEQ